MTTRPAEMAAKMPSVRIWQKKQIVLTNLNFRQHRMVKIGTVGVATVKNRVTAALGPDDGPAKPLTKRYAIRIQTGA